MIPHTPGTQSLARLLPTKAVEASVKGFSFETGLRLGEGIRVLRLRFPGSSLRRVKDLLSQLGARVNHVPIWRWLQRLGSGLKERLFRRRRRSVLVVDETEVRTRGGQIFVFVALDPENREIVNLLVTRHRETIDALGFLTRCLRFCEGKPVIVTDGGRWY